MVKHNFKIGDKVRLKNPDYWHIGNVMGIITNFDRCYIRVSWKGTKWESNTYPHIPSEIELAVKVGEQLMFNFMTGEK